VPAQEVQQFTRRLIALFLLAFAVRAAHVVSIGNAPFARLLIGDARSYDRWAREIAAGDWIGHQTFYQAPLYPYTLAAVYKVAGADPMRVRWVQAALGALACVALAVAGRRWLDDRAGLVAGALLALYPPAIFFDGLIQKASLDNFLMCSLLAVLGAYARRRSTRLLVPAGAILGLFALTRENALVFLAILVCWLPFFLNDRPVREIAASVLLLIAGVAIVLLPVGIRNRVVGGEFLVTTSQAGPNFYIGNGEQATGRYVPIVPGREMPEFERTDATAVAERAAGHSLTPGQVSSFWWSRSFAAIRAHPGQWATLLGKKALLTWNRAELPDTEALEVYRDYSFVLRVLGTMLGFGILCALGAAGMVVAWSRTPRPTLLYPMLFGFSAAVALFYVFARYRFPMVPILALFGACALVASWDGWRAGLRKPAAAPVSAALLAGAVALLPIVPGRGSRGLAYENLGIGFSDAGDAKRSAEFFRTAIDLEPREPGPHYNLAVALMRLGETEQAATELETTLRLDPANAPAHDNLGTLLAEHGDLADAAKHFREAYRSDPSSPLTMVNLGNAALSQGRAEEAVDWYRRALAAQPDYLDARLNLLQALERLGRTEDAATEARAVLRADPANAEAREALGRLGAQNR